MNSWWTRRLRPVAAAPRPHDLPLDGLRGSCALLVFAGHLFLPVAVLDPRWTPPEAFSLITPLGYSAVMIFFVLSGYVIGQATTTPASASYIRVYAVARVARLVPVAAVAVAISWLLLPSAPWRAGLGNFVFLQNVEPYPGLGKFPLLDNNPNLWSLNYEVIYYITFIAIWRLAPTLGAAAAVLGVLVGLSMYTIAVPGIIGRWACGEIYWLAGLAVAWCPETARSRSDATNWPAAALGAYAGWMIAPWRTACLHWHWFAWIWPAPIPVSPHRLDFLPYCLWLLLAVTGRLPKARRVLTGGCLLWAALGLCLHSDPAHWSPTEWAATSALAVSVVTAGWLVPVAAWARLAAVGGISYALYAIAAPLQLAQRRILPSFSGSPFTFCVRLVGVLILVGVASWFLERRVARRAARTFRRLPVTPAETHNGIAARR